MAWSIAEVARDSGLREQMRLGQLVRTVDATIENVRKGGEMTPDKVFEGFEHNPYEAEARERWGDEAVDASNERMRGWSVAEAVAVYLRDAMNVYADQKLTD